MVILSHIDATNKSIDIIRVCDLTYLVCFDEEVGQYACDLGVDGVSSVGNIR